MVTSSGETTVEGSAVCGRALFSSAQRVEGWRFKGTLQQRRNQEGEKGLASDGKRYIST